MTREDFIRQLRLSLQGRLPVEKIEEILSWYEEYILIQVRKGNDEAEVLSQLGEPRLLAVSIIAAAEAEDRKKTDGETSETKKQAPEGTEACNEGSIMNLLRSIINKIRGYYK